MPFAGVPQLLRELRERLPLNGHVKQAPMALAQMKSLEPGVLT